jgi:hypothetical protein
MEFSNSELGIRNAEEKIIKSLRRVVKHDIFLGSYMLEGYTLLPHAPCPCPMPVPKSIQKMLSTSSYV